MANLSGSALGLELEFLLPDPDDLMPSFTRILVAIVLFGLAATPSLAQVSVGEPWIRATVPGQKATGAFMRLTAAADASLVGATSPVAGVVEVHEMKMEGNVMKMSAVPRLPLPAGKLVELRPGSYHVMLMDLKRPLAEGEIVPLTLSITDQTGTKQQIEVQAKVRALTAAMPAHKAP